MFTEFDEEEKVEDEDEENAEKFQESIITSLFIIRKAKDTFKITKQKFGD